MGSKLSELPQLPLEYDNIESCRKKVQDGLSSVFGDVIECDTFYCGMGYVGIEVVVDTGKMDVKMEEKDLVEKIRKTYDEKFERMFARVTIKLETRKNTRTVNEEHTIPVVKTA